MRKIIHKLSRKETAQSMVEFALVFPLLLLITYGIIEMGRMLFIYVSLTSSAREGARYGAAAGDVEEMTRTPHYADCEGILEAVYTAAFLVQLEDADISIQYDHGPNTGAPFASCPPYDADGDDLVHLGDRIIVSVMGRYDPILPTGYIGFNGFDIHAENARTILLDIEIFGTPPTRHPTLTKTPTPLGMPTNTSTPTPTPTNTRTPTPTVTSTPFGAPTWTPTASPTSSPTPTSTPFCKVVSGPIGFDTNEPEFSVTWNVTNLSADPVRMVLVGITWPDYSPKPRLTHIKVNGINVWSYIPGADKSPLDVCEGAEGCGELFNLGVPSDRELADGQTVELKFVFSRAPNAGDYALHAIFLNLVAGGKCSTQNSATLPALP